MRKPVLVALLLASTLSTIGTAQTGRKKDRTVAGAAAGPVAPAASDKPQIGTFGFDMAGCDLSVAPGTDFFDHANGVWLKDTQIPADRSSYGMFHVLQDLSLTRTRGILDDAAKTPGDKTGDFYASFMDEAAVNAKGLSPVQPWLSAIAAAPDRDALLMEMATLQRQGVGGMIGMGVGQDDKDPQTYVASFQQGGLGLPDRDFYIKPDAKLAALRTAYQAYLAQMLTLSGVAPGQATARAAAVMAFETGIANAHWDSIRNRDADQTYNKWTAADFAAKAPGIPWARYMTALGVAGRPYYLVSQPSAVTGEAKLFATAPLPMLRDYATLKVLRAYAPYLSSDVDKANFAFYGTQLSGTPEQQVRWKRGVTATSGALGEAIGQVYVEKYFPPEAKAAADQLVANVIAAMGNRLRNLEWMAPETKTKALAKLAAFTPKIGYPTKWRDYSALVVTRGDLVGNVARANAFEYARGLKKLGSPLDRAEWFMTPMTINAYANPTMNEIVFPAAILQPPFFDPKADMAVNYGGIGAVIGHEMSHHFDDQGAKFNAKGELADWWTPSDVANFKGLTDKLVAQYDAYEPLPGVHVIGKLTLGENMADLAGLTVAYDAYHKALGGKAAPTIDGFTGDQRFYLGWTQVWRRNYREAQLRKQLVTDPHSPDVQRANIVRDMDPWYAAFSPAPTGKLYLTPDARVRVW